MTHPLACRVCPFLRPELSLSLKEVAERIRLARDIEERIRTQRAVPIYVLKRHAELAMRKYLPPCDLERMGAA